MATTIETITGADFGISTLPVLSEDPAGLATIATDFIFDALAARGYAEGVLPDVGSVVPTAGLLNLARNAALAIPRSAVESVVALPCNSARLPVFNGKGWSMSYGAREGFYIKKGGVSTNRVCEPVLENYADNLLIVWCTLLALPGPGIYYAPALLGQNGSQSQGWNGVVIPSNGYATARPSAYGWNIITGTPLQIAMHVDYDLLAGTSTQRVYINGVLTDTSAGLPPAAMVANNPNARSVFGANLAGVNGFEGVIHRIQREYTSKNGVPVSEMVAKDYAVNSRRFV